jgi:HEAT repeat protein
MESANWMESQHQPLQDSEAAETLLQQLHHLSDDQLKQEYLNDLQWTQPLTLMLQQVEEKSQALRVVKLALLIDWFLGAKLAGAVKPEFHAAAVGLVAGLEVPQLLKIQLLGITHSDSAIPLLLEALNEEDPEVCCSAASALGKIGTEVAVTALGKL